MLSSFRCQIQKYVEKELIKKKQAKCLFMRRLNGRILSVL